MEQEPILSALLGLVAWALLLTLALAAVRSAQVIRGKKKANEFPSGLKHGTDAEWRLNRAQINMLEFLPLYVGVMLTARLLDLDLVWLNRWAMIILFARIGQSLAHISSGSVLAVNIRFNFFAVQLVAVISMIFLIIPELT